MGPVYLKDASVARPPIIVMTEIKLLYPTTSKFAVVMRICAVLPPSIAWKSQLLWLLKLVLSPPQVHAGGLPVGSAAVPGEDRWDVLVIGILRVFDCASERPCAAMLHSTVLAGV